MEAGIEIRRIKCSSVLVQFIRVESRSEPGSLVSEEFGLRVAATGGWGGALG